MALGEGTFAPATMRVSPVIPEHMDLAGTYLADMGRTELLDADAERRLAQAIEAGRSAEHQLASGRVWSNAERSCLRAEVRRGREAREEFIAANLRLVLSFARRYRRAGVDLADLVQEGNIGLMHAVERFDWRRGLRFSTFGSWWIRRAIVRALDQAVSPVHVPPQVLADSRTAARARAELEVATGRAPTSEAVAAASGLAVEQVEAADRYPVRAVSLSAPAGPEQPEMGELLPDLTIASPESESSVRATREAIRELVATLPPRAASVLRLHYGLEGGRPMTLDEVGGKLGIGRERARQLERRALFSLRRAVTAGRLAAGDAAKSRAHGSAQPTHGHLGTFSPSARTSPL